MLNQSIFIGRIANEPVLEYTPANRTPYCRLRVAVERDYASKDGERKTDFLSCIAWKGTAEFIARYFRKGSMAAIRGRLEEDVWKDKEGNTRSRMTVNVSGIYFGETKKARQEREGRQSGYLPEEDFGEYTDADIPPDFDDAQLPF